MTTTKTKPVEQSAELALELTRVFDAPRNRVFEAWTQPEGLKHWWSPKGWTCPVSKVDLHPGGSYLNCMRSPEGKDYWSRGVYQEIVEPERLICTDMFADEEGNPVSPQDYGMSPDWPDEALIEVTFAEQAGKTKVTVRYSPIKSGDEREMCRQGWNECLDKLADYLTKERQ